MSQALELMHYFVHSSALKKYIFSVLAVGSGSLIFN